MRNQEVAFTLWFYYNQALPSSAETFIEMEDSGTVNMQAAFSVSGSDIVLDFFESTSTFTFPFSAIQNKWHFLGLYREGAIGGYAFNGVER